MGVTGLWRLVEPAGKPVPVETLENKVLAVDISIWLHQMVKGYQDAKGAPLPNAHLMGLFQRLCKLLYFRIKPIFVFDGGFPDLKRDTIAKRQDHKLKYNSESERLKRELALLLSKKTVISSLLGKQISPKKGGRPEAQNDEDIFKLPALPETENGTESESDDDQDTSSGSIVDLHSVDIESNNFKNLPTKEKYDLLVELKETRKMNSWGKLHELPKKSDNFSDFQMQRLLKRRKVQECLEETEKEMGDIGMSLIDLESLLNEEGISTKIDNLPTRRIASNDTTRFLLINDVKKTLVNMKKAKEMENKPSTIEKEDKSVEEQPIKKDELEEDLQKAIQMSLECTDEPSTSENTSKTEESWTSVLTDTDSEEGDGFEQSDLTSAKAYIMQYSDFTYNVINKIVTSRSNDKNNPKSPKVNKIIEELNKEKSIIVDKIDLSSDEDKIRSSSDNLNKIIDIESDTELKTEPDNLETSINNENMDTDDLSVICVNDSVQNITFNTSTYDDVNISQTNHFEDKEHKKETDSSDDDFEEVPEEENKPNKPVVQLMLNMGSVPDDDIFADIFTDKEKSIPSNNDNSDSAVITKDVESTETKILENQENIDIKSNAQMKVQKENISKSSENLNKMDSLKATASNINNSNSPHLTNESGKSISDMKDNVVIKVNKETENQKEVISTETLNTMVEDMQDEEINLLHEKGRLERVGRNITEQMTKEAQELLQIFGIPYIVAPMEAEAQCAFLENVKLTDGTITDDSDIWLFGGRTVYKNFFNQKKHVLQFLSERIEKSFNLTREKLILLALLVGSDYTTGVTGVGPVTALEILASFPFNKRKVSTENLKQARYLEIVAGLEEFKEWVRAGARTDNSSLKKKLKNVDLTDDFPSVRVVQAYLEPNVEKSEEKFTWGEIDITILRDYTKAKFGWSQNKLDEIVKPVLKRILERRTQKTVDDYFKRKIDFQSLEDRMSKRVKAAVQKMGPEGLQEIYPETNKKTAKKRLKNNSNTGGVCSKASIVEAEPPKGKRKKKSNDKSLIDGVKIVSGNDPEDKTNIQINIPKTDRYQEIIPQREKDKQNILENKLKAIETFRKTKIDRKRKIKKRVVLPKEKAELSESSGSD